MNYREELVLAIQVLEDALRWAKHRGDLEWIDRYRAGLRDLTDGRWVEQ